MAFAKDAVTRLLRFMVGEACANESFRGHVSESLMGKVNARLEELERQVALNGYIGNSVRQSCEPLKRNGRPFRVGLSMNLANNLFHLSNGMRAAGVDAELVLYRSGMDYRMLGDPRWEMAEVEIHDFVAAYESPEMPFLPPGLPVGVREIESDQGMAPYKPHPLAEQLVGNWPNYRKYLARLQSYDVLLVSGPAIAFAPFTGKPYVTFPFGGDLREDPVGDSWFSRLLMAGWKRANGHILSGTNFAEHAKRFGLDNYTFIPLFIDTELYKPELDNKYKEELSRKYGSWPFLFMPSRHNWVVKGQDRVVAAISELKKQGKFNAKLLMSSWGDDYGRSVAYVKKLGLEEDILFVPALSKALLRKYMSASDIVIDQFCIGEYGALTLEAMAIGRPVMLHYGYANPPPILNALTSHEIASGIIHALENPEQMEDLGRRARDWVVATHGPPVIEKFITVFEAILSGARVPDYPPFMA